MSMTTNRPDFTKEVTTALLAGNVAAAELLIQHGDCDFLKQTDKLTLLAKMILLDALFPIATDRIDAFFTLASSINRPPRREALFWNCAELDDEGQHQLTALHFAFISHEVDDARGTIIPVEEKERILPRLLEEFHEPHFLNAQVHLQAPKYGGDTILHIAARQGCTGAINTLLDRQHTLGIDLNILNSYQQTPTDLCIMHYESLFNELEDQLMTHGSLSAERTLVEQLNGMRLSIVRLLTKVKCKISTFCLVAMRSETTVIFLRRPDTLIYIPCTEVCSLQGRFQDGAADISQLLELEVNHFIPYVDKPSDYGKILSSDLNDLIQMLS
ncbi:hypothetical protein ZTR_10825 [Talaromyces verruculosus]|nr:hypothetical protein ZTR_10825 [Talaromyces verruculosus]